MSSAVFTEFENSEPDSDQLIDRKGSGGRFRSGATTKTRTSWPSALLADWLYWLICLEEWSKLRFWNALRMPKGDTCGL